jgi:DNA-directed RNA polymerase subunit RPC12/RpoP
MTEVRRCATCQQAAVTLVTDWKHTQWGSATGMSTRDYRCQACGRKFTIHPRMNAIALVIAGVIMLPIGIGLIPLWMAWARSRTDKKNPIVPGEPPPHLRYRDGPPLRDCVCGGAAVVAKIKRSTTNGLPTGTEVEYRCPQCQKQFTIESAWGMTFSLFSGALLFAIAFWAYAASDSALSRYGWGIGLSVLGGFLVWSFIERLRNRFTHPPKPDLLLE